MTDAAGTPPAGRDPRTDAEWQDAVDAATTMLALESARAYGIVAGGPGVNVARCQEIIAAGRAQGIVPARDAIEKVAADLAHAIEPQRP